MATTEMTPTPALRRVGYDEPWRWLARGWDDLWRAPASSLGYGLLFVVASLLVLAAVLFFDALWLLPALSAGFLLVAPVLAVGLYEISRRLEAGESVGLRDVFGGLRRNGDQIAFFGVLLSISWLMWIQFSLLMFMLAFGRAHIDPRMLLDLDFLLGDAFLFCVLGVGVGAVVAGLVFAATAISLPMLVDGPYGAPEAVAASWAAVRMNPAAFLVWAALIGVFTLAGALLLFVGLAVTLPLLGHATWHAYRGVVGRAG